MLLLASCSCSPVLSRAACFAPPERGADVPPSVAALTALRALQMLGCCEMVILASLLSHGAPFGGSGEGESLLFTTTLGHTWLFGPQSRVVTLSF